jgi:hypothetical protein
MKISKLLEARRNPALNKKMTVLQQLLHFSSKAGEINFMGESVPYTNTFVSFTAIQKLGINPKSPYDMVGIYAYPIDYVIGQLKDADKNLPQASEIPFASDQPYLQIFTIKESANVILASEPHAKMQELKAAIGKMAARNVDVEVRNHIIDAADRLNSTSQLLRFIISPAGFTSSENNTIFREVGIDVIIDPGDSIIHSNEPEQTVIMMCSENVLEHVGTIMNTSIPGEDVIQKTDRFHTTLERSIGENELSGDVASAIDSTVSPHRKFDLNWVSKSLETFKKLPRVVQNGRVGRMDAGGYYILMYLSSSVRSISGNTAEFKKLLMYANRHVSLIEAYMNGVQKIDEAYRKSRVQEDGKEKEPALHNDKLDKILLHLKTNINTGHELNLFCKQPKFVELVGKLTIAKKAKNSSAMELATAELLQFLNKAYPFLRSVERFSVVKDDLAWNLDMVRREIFRTYLAHVEMTAPE